MYAKQSKKMLPFSVLDVLQRYTDANHRLTQRDIEKILVDQYDMAVDRRSIKRSIMDLIEMGVDIQYNEITRIVNDRCTGEAEEQAILTDFYLERDFSDCEIRLLIDDLLDLKCVPDRQRRQLISKLEGLSSVYFRRRRDTSGTTYSEKTNNQLFYTIDIIDEAITSCNKISFKYKTFKVGENGSIKVDHGFYIVTPHDTKVMNGKYLLICSVDGTEMALRIDYISDISIVTEKSDERAGERQHRNKQETRIRFLASEKALSVFIEVFGQQSIRIEDAGEDIILNVKAEEGKAVEFGVSNSDAVTVISPESVRCTIIDRLQSGMKRYA